MGPTEGRAMAYGTNSNDNNENRNKKTLYQELRYVSNRNAEHGEGEGPLGDS